MERKGYSAPDTVAHLWAMLVIPQNALNFLHLPIDTNCYPSSFKIGHLAQASIGLSALSAALVWSIRNNKPVPNVIVPAGHACAEFKSGYLYVLNGEVASSSFGTIGGLHKTRDGHT